MNTPLVQIDILSCYPIGASQKLNLSAKVARCTPDAKAGILAIDAELKTRGGKLVLSDLFRSYDMQLQSHNDYVNKKKKAYSPPPGGSLHEAGRAFDMDLSQIKVPLSDFWEIAAKHGFLPIIATPNPNMSECWHFDCAGSHRLVFDYYKAGNGKNLGAYAAMASSAINAVGIKVDVFAGRAREAFIQAGAIRLGGDPGNIDGYIGKRTWGSLEPLGITPGAGVPAAVYAISNLLKQKFPKEYA